MKQELPIFLIIASIISSYKKKELSDIDLYNSIIRLLDKDSPMTENNLKEISKVSNWLRLEEEKNTELREQYKKDNVIRNVGENYFEGLDLLANN